MFREKAFFQKGLLTLVVLVLTACSAKKPLPSIATEPQRTTIPTSEACANIGGITIITHSLQGSELRMCQTSNGKQCEEALLSQGACASRS